MAAAATTMLVIAVQRMRTASAEMKRMMKTLRKSPSSPENPITSSTITAASRKPTPLPADRTPPNSMSSAMNLMRATGSIGWSRAGMKSERKRPPLETSSEPR